MKKDIIKYLFMTIIIILILGFIYPTVYRYDKYDQKIPVRINRITGVAEMLYQDGWEKAKTETPTKTVMQNFNDSMEVKFDSLKRELDTKFEGLKSDVETDISNKLRAEILKDIQSDIKKAKEEIKVYKESKLDPNNSFTVGSTTETVKKIMGPPDSISTSSYMSYWYYGSSMVNFNSGKVEGWSLGDTELNIK